MNSSNYVPLGDEQQLGDVGRAHNVVRRWPRCKRRGTTSGARRPQGRVRCPLRCTEGRKGKLLLGCAQRRAEMPQLVQAPV